MIEGQNDTMAKLREMLHQSQLKQLHVCEDHPGPIWSQPLCTLITRYRQAWIWVFVFNVYLFISLCWVLVAAHGICVAACEIFSCSLWDLVP